MPSSARPGSRLAGRYLLQGSAGGSARDDGTPIVTWRGHDELLNRPVSVRILSTEDPSAQAVLAAAQLAAALPDPRMLAILDAAEADGLVYVVSEWIEGRTLTEVLADGPLPPAEAARIAGEVARGLAAAHAAGIAHRCLNPGAVLLADSGRVKLVGLGIDAAVHGQSPHADAAARLGDLRAVGALLYAGLTRRWPQIELVPQAPLPSAPVADGLPCAPRQVRAAIPVTLDEITQRALGLPTGRRSAPPFTDIDELASALLGPAGTGETGPQPAYVDDEGVHLLAAPEQQGTATRLAGWVVAAVLAVGVALLVWQLAVTGEDSPAAPPATTTTSAPPSPSFSSAPVSRDLPVKRLVSFDPQGDGTENQNRVGLATDDDNEGTAWTTKEYYNHPFGGIKDGVGLVVDLGRVESVQTVALNFVGFGSSVELRTTTATGGTPPAKLAQWKTVASAEQVGAAKTLRPQTAVRTRYLLVWLTALPSSGDNTWRGGISDLRVRS